MATDDRISDDYITDEELDELLEDEPPQPSGVFGSRAYVRVLADALDNPRQNGLFMVVVGLGVAVGSVLLLMFADFFFPVLIPAGVAVASVGVWLIIVPVPRHARDILLGLRDRGDAWWLAWQVGLILFVFGGLYLGYLSLLHSGV